MSTNTLIIWLWEETLDDDVPVWRGTVNHVQSGRLVYVQTLADLYRQIALIVDGKGGDSAISTDPCCRSNRE